MAFEQSAYWCMTGSIILSVKTSFEVSPAQEIYGFPKKTKKLVEYRTTIFWIKTVWWLVIRICKFVESKQNIWSSLNVQLMGLWQLKQLLLYCITMLVINNCQIYTCTCIMYTYTQYTYTSLHTSVQYSIIYKYKIEASLNKFVPAHFQYQAHAVW